METKVGDSFLGIVLCRLFVYKFVHKWRLLKICFTNIAETFVSFFSIVFCSNGLQLAPEPHSLDEESLDLH